MPEITEELMSTIRASFKVALVLSQLGSLSIIVTGLIFWNSMVRRKLYMQILMIVSVCDLLGSNFYMYLPSSKALCDTQGFIWTYFFRASWLWTTMIPICLYMQVKKGWILKLRYSHLIVWSINTIIAVLPFTDGVYYGGTHDGKYICTFSHWGTKGVQWYAATIITPCLVCAMVGVIILLLLEHERRKMYSDTSVGKLIAKLISNTIGYPIGLFFFWMPFGVTFVDTNNLHVAKHHAGAEYDEWMAFQITGIFACLFGLFLAALFFTKSREARQRWRRLLFAGGSNNNTDNPRLGLIEEDDINDFEYDDEYGDRISLSMGGQSERPTRDSEGDISLHGRDSSARDSARRSTSEDFVPPPIDEI